jgi:N6-adenosine-specific RNA methylase IME4
MKLPKKKFKVIYADPPWEQKTWSDKGKEGRPQHYKRMTLQEIKDLPIADIADQDCWLLLWTTGPHLEQAFEVIRAWGFKYSGMGFVWIKLNMNAPDIVFKVAGIVIRLIVLSSLFMGGGYTTRKNAEFCLLARRGKPKRIAKDVHEVIISPRREHSRKPDEIYSRIMRFARGPYVELFARTRRDGWTAIGNETNKFQPPERKKNGK